MRHLTSNGVCKIAIAEHGEVGSALLLCVQDILVRDPLKPFWRGRVTFGADPRAYT